MKVSDIMHRSVVTVTEETFLKEVGRIIFSLGIAGVPVVRGKKLVGIITEQDILSKMHPTMQEIVEDYFHATNFETMAKNMKQLLETTVGSAMNPNVVSVTADTDLMKAHSLMMVNKFSRLPIVNNKNELIGIISQGDVFRSIIKDEIPELEMARYAGFIGRYYDQMIDWEKRFNYEFPTLFKLFQKEKVKNVLDIGVWTGEYTIGLAKKSSYSILGLDHNPTMIKMANDKKKRLPKDLRQRLDFALTNFIDMSSIAKRKFDALICMGNALPYVPLCPDALFKEVSKIMAKNATVVLQLLNFEKILKSKNRLLSFGFQKASDKEGRRHLSVEFFDHKNKDILLHNTVIFDYDGINWIYKGITTIEVRNIKKEYMEQVLKNCGFKSVSFSGSKGEYQGESGQLSFEGEFKPLESDWLNVVAKR